MAPAATLAEPLRPAASAPLVPRTGERVAQPAFVPGEAIVRFESGTTAAERLSARRAADAELERSLAVPRAQLLEVDGDVAAAVERLERQPDVAFAQPNYRYRALAAPVPNDTFFGDLWGLGSTALPAPGVDALEAWESNRGGGQVVAVVDTGVAIDHPDLQGNLWTGPGGIHGHDFVDDDSDPDDYEFHGTHVAGTVAAVDGNGLGIAGVAPDAQIMAIRVLDGNGSGSSADIGAGIAFAAQNGADVINLSLGGDADSDPLMSSGIAIADSLDAVVVAAAGNESNDNDANGTVPCNLPHPNVICVAAVNEAGELADFSNYGATTVDVGAPGTRILSAETDYAAVHSDGFASFADLTTGTANGGVAWGTVATPNTDGNPSAADSPSGNYGQAVDHGFYAASVLAKATPLSLAGRYGCRMAFHLRYELEDGYDLFFAGTGTPDPNVDPFVTGSSGGSFFDEGFSISHADGSASVTPRFTLLSDYLEERDGVYLDQWRVLCRDSSYSNAAPPTGNYVRFQGTSMAAPHVAGVAALVRAAVPGLADTAVVQAIEEGGAPLDSLSGTTVSGRTADADGAIAVGLGEQPPSNDTGAPPDPTQPVPTQPDPTLPSPTQPDPVQPDPSPLPGPAPPPPAPRPVPHSPLSPPLASSLSLAGAKAALRVSRRGVFRYTFRATPSLAGRIAFRTRRKVRIARRTHLSLAAKTFSAPATGRVAVKVRLSKRQLRILRRNGRFLLRVTATARGNAGESLRASRGLTLRPPIR
ncbi:MAG TPA: S8 family serine peptidase [Thermoleophilaceae bacterium]|nr:S8 family serine peptidase [Thermoleophilaceae bacterium]